MSRIHIERWLGNGAGLSAVLDTDRGKLVTYRVVLLVWEDQRWRTVRLWDNVHGRHEMHRYTHDGEKQDPVIAPHSSPDEAYQAANRAITIGWRKMVEGWRR